MDRTASVDAITITVNGSPQRIVAQTLEKLVTGLGYADAKIATAVNREFVPAALRSHCQLAEGDHIEIVAPRQGG